MEQSALDISAMKYGNLMLARWLKDEESFWKSLLKSLPIQICMVSVYDSLVKSGEIKKTFLVSSEVFAEIDKWSPNCEPNKASRLAKAISALIVLAEIKLKVTAGV